MMIELRVGIETFRAILSMIKSELGSRVTSNRSFSTNPVTQDNIVSCIPPARFSDYHVRDATVTIYLRMINGMLIIDDARQGLLYA